MIPAPALKPCGCPDPTVGAECHCALLRDFPGGFYGDDDNAEYMNDTSLWCDCDCHGSGDDDFDYSDDQDEVADPSRTPTKETR